MNQIHTGGSYRLDIPTDVHDNAIEWVNQRSRKFFLLLREIDGKKIVVRSKIRSDPSRCIVSLIDLPQDTFNLSKKYIIIENTVDSIPCTCDLYVLVNKGCRCGAFQKEKGQNKLP